MKRTVNRFGVCLAAAALAGSVLPLTAGPTGSAGAATSSPARPAARAVAVPSFGYSTSAWATPMKIEIYEPTIPIPATPQAELNVGYSEVVSDSASSRGRASYLWPGGPVGEGFKTIAEQFMLPAAIADGGYPIQVNAGFPTGNKSESDEPAPGMIQRADAGEGSAHGVSGFSGDGEADDPDDTGGGGGGGGRGGGGGLLGLPGVSSLPGLGGFGTSVPASAAADPAPALPPALSALVDSGSFISESNTVTKKNSTADSRAHVGDVKVLGGAVTISGVTTRSSVSTDGKKAKADGVARYGTLTALGQKFAFGPDGFEAVGQGAPIPGLPDQAVAALKQLGLTISVPKPVYEVKGDMATSTVSGLVLDFDLTKLKSKLPELPLGDLIGQLPDEAGQLKSLLGGAANLSPRIVYTLAVATSSVDTAPPPVLPDVTSVTTPDETAPETVPQDAPPASSSSDAPKAATPPGSSSSTPGGSSAPAGDVPVAEAPAADAALLLPTSAPTAPGLPKLYSLPGLLLLGALLGAAFGGGYLRRIGLAALGGAGSCGHGLDSGLPDLRKVD